MPAMSRSPGGWPAAAVFLLLMWLADGRVLAQQRPVLSEDPDPVGAGKMLIEAGIDHAWAQRFPVSGLDGNLLRGPLLGISNGIGPSAEVQVDGLSWSRLAIKERFDAPLSGMVESTGDTTSSVDDIVVGTKVRLLSETARRPSFGFRFATRLPIAGNETGIGLDTMDFYHSVLIAKSIHLTRVVGNFGLAILSDPTRGDRQNDVMTYGFSLLQGIGTLAVVADVNGWVSTRGGTPPPGTDTRGTATLGLRYPVGPVRLDGGYYTGVTASDDRSGLTAGITWMFDSFIGE